MSNFLRSRFQRQEGQSIVIAALMLVVLFGFASLAVDTGLAAADRRDIQAAVDQGALAGSREYGLSGDTDSAHFVALQYITNALRLTMASVSPSCIVSACSQTTHTIGTNPVRYTFTFTDNAANGTIDISTTHLRDTAVAGAIGMNRLTVGTSARAKSPGPITDSAGYAVMTLGGDFLIHGGGVRVSPSGDVTGNVYANGGTAGGNNGPHAILVPTQPTDSAGNVCSPSSTSHVDVTGTSNGGNVDWNQVPPVTGPITGSGNVKVPVKQDPYAGFPAPTTTGPTFTSVVNNQAGSALQNGVWQPGTYDHLSFPAVTGPSSGHTLAPGVYVIKNDTQTITLGDNNMAVADGTVNKNGGVAIVLDSSDTGSLSLSGTHLNGYDDDGSSPRDPQGTHNFVIYGPTYTQSATFDDTILTGIVELPKSDTGSHGNNNFTMYGELVSNSFTLNGGGNGTQQFFYVCNLQSVANTTGRSGLIR